MSRGRGKRQRIRVWLGMGHDKRTFIGRLVPALVFGRWAVHRAPGYDGDYHFCLADYLVTVTHVPSGRQGWQFDRDDLDQALAIAQWMSEHDTEYMHPLALDADWKTAGDAPASDGIGIVRGVCAAGIAPWYWANYLTDLDEAAASVRLDGETQEVSQ